MNTHKLKIHKKTSNIDVKMGFVQYHNFLIHTDNQMVY